MSSLPAKRPASPLPLHLDNINTTRLRLSKEKDEAKNRSTPIAPGSHGLLSAGHGQEVLSISSSLQLELRHEHINDLILQTTARLGSEGKRLVRAPRLL